jgi:hypothetical protein
MFKSIVDGFVKEVLSLMPNLPLSSLLRKIYKISLHILVSHLVNKAETIFYKEKSGNKKLEYVYNKVSEYIDLYAPDLKDKLKKDEIIELIEEKVEEYINKNKKKDE